MKKLAIIFLIIIGSILSITASYSYWAQQIDTSQLAQNTNIEQEIGNWATFNKLKYQEINGKSYHSVSSYYNYNVAIGKEGQLYAWGYGLGGQLGISPASNLNTPTEVAFFKDKKIVSVKAGYRHVLALTDQGELYAWGNNEQGALGLGSVSAPMYPLPREVLYFKTNNIKIVSIEAGNNSSYAITDKGEVYSWGYNIYYKLGQANLTSYSTPTKIDFFSSNNIKIKDIKTQFEGAIALTDQGDLYAWGYSANGELGIGAINYLDTPRLIVFPESIIIKSYTLGMYHAMVLTSEDKVYVWGYNAQGQLGLGDLTRRTTPVINQGLTNLGAKNIFAGVYSSSAMITKDNKIYTWGNNSSHKIGYDRPAINPNPQILNDIPRDIEYVNIALGTEHTIIEDKHGSLYALGLNTYGQLGIGTNTSTNKVEQINLLSWISIKEEMLPIGYKFNLYEYEKIGYKFLGWYLDKNYQEKFESNSVMTESINNVYAKWIKI
ncbi:predicted regulator of chromosome condensation RCC [Alteracholeplasma palmae J233]|uniref:Predicted regulator of chromosome condensation RCC n=1 Tax=Alteracholeplasma palmae (strain ATCC 49389 / J233) TaxID=1318466 RepID=U4KKH6_ALTPJ|nr:InlB B-repeat-containing protein [Alteracholeplasma palmae]CCV64239.1 predicted regulator of chromosome condensation RCC [Alteracholeplasma palmae J233]